MNNIEINQLKTDLVKYLKYNENQIKELVELEEVKLSAIKTHIQKLKNKEYDKSTQATYQKRLLKKKINNIVGVELPPSFSGVELPPSFSQRKSKKNKIKHDGKPRILFVSDVKGWAWWLKSEFIKKHLSNEFDIDIVHVLGKDSTPINKIDQKYYDLYFTYGFSYIQPFYRVPKFKKATGITAHRRKHIIFPRMKMAGHVHANSKLLLNELHEMGFKDAFYIPNGVDENLFRPITPIKKDGELIVGHVGKECPVKGQREYILPAIKKCGVKSSTNMRTWKDKLPHIEMPRIYNEMDVFVVASIEDGTPNPALEAAACGRPIISNHIGNMPEFIKDGYNGFLVPRRLEAYIEKIKYFKKNRDELIRMGENARKTIEESWTWKRQAERYRDMFRTIFEK